MATLLAYALTTVEDVKESLGISSGDNSRNNLIIRKINQATLMIENYCQRRFKQTTYTDEEYDGTSIDQLILKQRPIISSETFTLSRRDTTQNQDDWSEVDTDNYFIDYNAGIVEGSLIFHRGWNRFKVTYTAGYETIPADLAEACAMLASYMVENGVSGTSIASKEEGQRKISYHKPDNNNDIFQSLGIDDIITSYMNFDTLLEDK